MKKSIIIFTILMTLPCLLFGSEKRERGMEIAGYIDNVMYLNISEFKQENDNNGRGINLNHEDSDNDYSYLIAPTATPLSLAGLMIANFDVMTTFNSTSYSSAQLTITHNKLIKNGNASIQYDYELAVKYQINDGNTLTDEVAKFCYCTTAASDNSIVISLQPSNVSKMASIKNAGIYFRLTLFDPISEEGDYTSNVTFSLEAN